MGANLKIKHYSVAVLKQESNSAVYMKQKIRIGNEKPIYAGVYMDDVM